MPFTRYRMGWGWILALAGWMLLTPASLATAQTSGGNQPTKTSTETHPAHHAVHRRHHAKRATETVAPAAVAPPLPLRPAEQPPNPATIEYSNGLLSVRAQNSSLVSILKEIQHKTGLAIDGLSHDQRMYGQYGPGTIPATLTALLDGSGYDFIIVGSGGGHSAAQLILSPPGSSGAATTASPATSTPQETAPQEGNQAGPADPTAPPQPKTPEEIFNEMRSRQPQ